MRQSFYHFYRPKAAAPTASGAVADSGDERAAAVYSLIGTCALNDIDPRAYLYYALARIADHKVPGIDELLPLACG